MAVLFEVQTITPIILGCLGGKIAFGKTDRLLTLGRKMDEIAARLESIEIELRDLRDRRDILACVSNYARGCDRHDGEVLSRAFHEDGVDEHGFKVNPGPLYWVWANEQHSRGSLINMHHITTHLCEIDGDEAHTESYVIGLFLNPDGKTSRILAGRYIDRLERRDGRWGIVVRRTTVEVALGGDASSLSAKSFSELGYLKSMRDKRDLTYDRPLTMEATAHERW